MFNIYMDLKITHNNYFYLSWALNQMKSEKSNKLCKAQVDNRWLQIRLVFESYIWLRSNYNLQLPHMNTQTILNRVLSKIVKSVCWNLFILWVWEYEFETFTSLRSANGVPIMGGLCTFDSVIVHRCSYHLIAGRQCCDLTRFYMTSAWCCNVTIVAKNK